MSKKRKTETDDNKDLTEDTLKILKTIKPKKTVLIDIPLEILKEICHYLNKSDIKYLRLVNRFFRLKVIVQPLWKQMVDYHNINSVIKNYNKLNWSDEINNIYGVYFSFYSENLSYNNIDCIPNLKSLDLRTVKLEKLMILDKYLIKCDEILLNYGPFYLESQIINISNTYKELQIYFRYIQTNNKIVWLSTLDWACYNQYYKLANHILTTKDVSEVINEVGCEGNTPLYHLITNNHIEYDNDAIDILKLLIKKGADVNLCKRDKSNKISSYPLQHACFADKFLVVKILLDAKADLSYSGYFDKSGYLTIPHKTHFQERILNLLIEHKEKYNI